MTLKLEPTGTFQKHTLQYTTQEGKRGKMETEEKVSIFRSVSCTHQIKCTDLHISKGLEHARTHAQRFRVKNEVSSLIRESECERETERERVARGRERESERGDQSEPVADPSG